MEPHLLRLVIKLHRFKRDLTRYLPPTLSETVATVLSCTEAAESFSPSSPMTLLLAVCLPLKRVENLSHYHHQMLTCHLPPDDCPQDCLYLLDPECWLCVNNVVQEEHSSFSCKPLPELHLWPITHFMKKNCQFVTHQACSCLVCDTEGNLSNTFFRFKGKIPIFINLYIVAVREDPLQSHFQSALSHHVALQERIRSCPMAFSLQFNDLHLITLLPNPCMSKILKIEILVSMERGDEGAPSGALCKLVWSLFFD